MKFALRSFLILQIACLTGCQTWSALKNSLPVKMLDDAGSELMGYITENNLPADGKPASMQERARQIESRGSYAGQAPAAGSPAESVAAR